MQFIEAGGARIPAIGLGTWPLSGEDAVELIAGALRGGYRHVDTAAIYGNEREVGEAIRASGIRRDEIFLTTKVWYTDLAAADVRRSAEASLKRLRLDQVDLLLVHWPSRRVPLKQTLDAFDKVRREGMTRHIGVSNFPSAMLEAAVALSPSPIVCNQVEYHSYLDQARVLAACRRHGIAVTAYSPLGRGTELFAEPAVANAARAHGRTPAQIVLRWLVQQPGVAAIPRSSRIERVRGNAAVFDFALTEAEMAAIAALSNRRKRLCDYDFSPEWDPA